MKTKLVNKFAHLFPRYFWNKYAALSSQLGFNDVSLILSFDCDTDEDAAAALHLSAWMKKVGLKAAYAVPGVQLRRNTGIFKQIADQGAAFINHGFLPHAEWRNDRYWSITFYSEMTQQQIVDDIKQGHDAIASITGKEPRGFRTPHFGHYQSEQQLAFLHRTLKALKYCYSTSTIPRFAFLHGPIFENDGIYEIPVSGSYRKPFNILDSWQHVISPQHPVLKNDYYDLFTHTIDRLVDNHLPAVLNYYVDPAHVYQSDHFYRAIRYAVDKGVKTLCYEEFINLVEKK